LRKLPKTIDHGLLQSKGTSLNLHTFPVPRLIDPAGRLEPFLIARIAGFNDLGELVVASLGLWLDLVIFLV
jgi:hypothetical protein